jgi:porin
LVLTVFVFIIPSVQSAETADANEVTVTAVEKTAILSDPNKSSESTDVAELIAESKKAAKEDEAVSDANEVTATKADKAAILSDPNGTADIRDSTDITELVIESKTVLPRQMFEDEVIMRILRPYINAKQYLHDKYHMDIAFETATVYQRAAGGRRPREQATNNSTLFGLWHLSEDREDDIGVLGFSFEQRDNMTDHSVRDFSREVGSSFQTHGLNTDERSRTALRQLWWRKKIFDNIMTLTAGKIHHSSYYNRNNFAGNARTHFLSNAFSRNPNRLTPQDGLGINATIKPNDKYYISVGFGDARANTKTSGFDTIEDGDFFTAAEIGFTPTFTELGRGNYRFTFWHIDKTDKDIREGYGAALSFDQELKGDLGFFARYGYTEPQVTAIKNFASGGIVLRDSWGKKDSLFGVGVSWDQASDSGEDEYSMELFQRFQYTSHMQITPSVLVIFDPAQSDKSRPVPVFGIRFRSLF